MSLISRVIAAAGIAAVLSMSSFAQTVMERGVATVDTRRAQASANEKQQAIKVASVNAVNRYVAGLPASQQRAFSSLALDMDEVMTRYVTSSVILSEESDGRAKKLTTVVRAELNGTILVADLNDASGYSAEVSQDATEIVSIMVARLRASVQSFDTRVYTRSDTSSETNASVDASVDLGSEVAAVGSSYRESADLSANLNATVETSERSETGGSQTVRADRIEWQVTDSQDVDQQITGILTDLGLNIIPSEFVDTINLPAIRADFGNGDDLQPSTLRQMASGLQEYDIPYVLIGTLDVDPPGEDPLTGNRQVYVRVNAKLINLERRFPRVEAAIGPIQFAGLGPTESVARVNAVTLAAENVGAELVERFAQKNIR